MEFRDELPRSVVGKALRRQLLAEEMAAREHRRMTKILVVDNYDSFVFNLVQYLAQLGAEVEVRRNDDVAVDDAARRRGGRHAALAGSGHAGGRRASASR